MTHFYTMTKRIATNTSIAIALSLGASAMLAPSLTHAAPQDDVIFDMSQQVLKDLKNNAGLRSGDKQTVLNYVDSKIMPRLNFSKWVSSSVGPSWNKATSAEQNELMQVMRKYFVSTYSKKLVNNKVTSIDVFPANGNEVKTIIKTPGDQTTVVYYMENSGGWRVYDVAIGGVRVSSTYRNQFKNTVNKGGVPALIAELKAKTK